MCNCAGQDILEKKDYERKGRRRMRRKRKRWGKSYPCNRPWRPIGL
jgi:hypothetical protein